MIRLGKFRSPRARERRRRLLYGRIAAAGIVLCLLVGSFLYLMNRPELLVREVRVAGSAVVPQQRLLQLVEEKTKGTWFGLISKQNALFYPRSTLERSLLVAVPYLKEAKVQRTGLTSASIVVRERIPFARWCGDIIPLPGEALPLCYLMDAEGFLFAPAPQDQGGPTTTLPRYFGALKRGVPEGQHFIEPTEFRRISDFVSSLEADTVPVFAVVMLDEEEAEVRLESGTRILFNRADVSQELFHRLYLARNAQEAVAKDLSDVAYIDLRFGERLYVKRRP